MNSFPKHIAFIMDGNRRWSKKYKKDLSSAYHAGGNKLCQIVDMFRAFKKPIILSFFAFSKENWRRPQEELDTLFSCIACSCRDILSRYNPGEVFFKFIGDRAKWPLGTKKILEQLEATFKQQAQVKVIIALNYSGQWDIDQAVESAINASCPAQWSNFLQAAQFCEPEILIRTGLQQRISNYYLYNISYTELYFPKVLWPDFQEDHLEEILSDYLNVVRNFGSSTHRFLREPDRV